jgi:uncharacterized protein (DUF885 family)
MNFRPEARMQRILATLVVLVGFVTIGLGHPAPETAPAAAQATPAAAAGQSDAESERLHAWFEAKYKEQLARSPIGQTFQGIKDRYAEIDDMSEAAQLEQLAWQRQSVVELRRDFDYDRLNSRMKLAYDLWVYQLQQAEAGLRFINHGYVFEQMNGPQSFLPTFLIQFHAVASESDMEAYVARIGGVARAMNQLVARAAQAAERGIRPPRFAYDGVIDQAAKVVTGAPFTEGEDSSLWADAKGKVKALVDASTITVERGRALEAAARDAFTGRLLPEFRALLTWLERDRANADVVATGVHRLPEGEAYYRTALQASTTTDLTPDAVHEIGLSEVARLRGDMEALKQQVGFEGDLQAFFTFIRDSKDDRRFYFPDTDEGRQAYISEAEERINFLEQRLGDYFGILPKADLIVQRVESFREQDGAAQHYFPGTPDGSRPGIYYAHLSDMTAMPRNELEVIAYHEGLPGHHMQISIAQELEGVPTFQTQAFFGAYVEGWALYSEYLAKEMGAYQEPYSEFGRLGSEIWRAIRLVVDTGLHTKGWTEQQAIDYFSANSPAPTETIVSEVRRYIVWPGQATSYKIGMLKILELREYAKAELGDRFDIKGFHTAVLGNGALPLVLLERQVEDWVERVKATDGSR